MLLKVFRFCALILALSASTQGRFTEEEAALMNQVHTQCVSESGTSEDLIAKGQKGDFSEDEKFMCYMKCIWSTMTVMNDDGEFDLAVLEVMLPADMKETVMKAMKACSNEGGSTPCEKAYKMTVCLYKEAPADFFIP